MANPGRNAALGVAAAAVAVAMAGGWYGCTFNQLHLVNGLPVPVVVEVKGTAHRVEPGARVKAGRFHAGALELVARREDGQEVERVTASLAASGTNVYSVLGAAPLTVATFFYGPTGTAPEPQVTSSCAGPSFRVYDVDHPFEEPPATIQVSSKTAGTQRRTVLRLDDGGINRCLAGTRVDALPLAELAAKVTAVAPEPDVKRTLLRYAGDAFARAGKPERAVALVAPLLEDPKATVEDHRLVQDLFRSAGRSRELLERYQARHEAQHTAESAYLFARLAEPTLALATVEEALQKAPEDGWLHRIRLWCLDLLTDWPRALAEAEWFLAHPELEDAAAWAREVKVRALVAQARGAEALELLEAGLDAQPRWALEDGILVDRVARAAGVKPWTDVLGRLSRPEDSATEKELFRYFFEVSAGWPSPARPARARLEAFDVLEASRTNPTLALSRVEALPADRELYFTPEAAWVLLGEAWRVGNQKATARLAGYVQGAGDGTELKRFLTDGDEAGLRDAPPQARLALLLARARALMARGDTEGAKALVKRLEAADPLRGLAVQAVTAWESQDRPKPEAERALQRSGSLPEGLKAGTRRK